MPFVTSDDPRRAHETCWLLDVRSLTNPPDMVISSPKTKGSVIPPAEWSCSEDSATVSQGRRAKIIFAGKLRNPYFCHIFGMERQFFFVEKGYVSAWPRI